MFSHRALGLMAGIALSLLLPISAAHACACCAEPGDRFDRAEAIDEYALDVLAAVKFEGKARLYTTAADWAEQIKGITNPAESDTYDLKASRTARSSRSSRQSNTSSSTPSGRSRRMFVVCMHPPFSEAVAIPSSFAAAL